MEKRVSSAANQDAIDWFTEEVTRNPARADELKRVLRDKIGLKPEQTGVALPWRRPAEDPEDYWDNVPV